MKNRLKKVVITTGMLLCLAAAPIVQNNPMGQFLNEITCTMEVQAAELPYSTRWETQADGSWKYKLDAGGYATNRWVQDEVDKNWYLLDSNGVMRTGVYKSYDKYYLLSEVHDGHYGHLVKNGEVYQGVTISASTNAEDEGALTESTLSALRNAGVNVDNIQDVSGTTHTTGGQDVAPSTEVGGNTPGNTTQTSGGAQGTPAKKNPFEGLMDNTGGYGGVDKDVADRIAAGMQGGDYN